jgi:3D (Asp-Asp-Asp) domain-containing protein
MASLFRHIRKVLILSIPFIIIFIYFNSTIWQLKATHRHKVYELKKEYSSLQILTDKIILDRENQLMEKMEQLKILSQENEKLKSYLNIKNVNFEEQINKSPSFKITAYDLSVQSCGKSRTSRGFGITASGYKLTGQTLRSASTISTDPKVIPLGTPVYLYFGIDSLYNGIYISSDTGSGIKGNHIDLFIGDNNSTVEASNFGIKYAKVILLDKI